ncbi:hypothetical protein OPV22_001244 [Ensete ventricosum]|uniref:Uncharacterized protein n=1 Tax=Ensete ventricosum TaxID=4639 RepID=A0AAV8RQZ5_ENSVE|nr:hypothetical protein OPV22_001244 [Ensete ventricosum]
MEPSAGSEVERAQAQKLRGLVVAVDQIDGLIRMKAVMKKLSIARISQVVADPHLSMLSTSILMTALPFHLPSQSKSEKSLALRSSYHVMSAKLLTPLLDPNQCFCPSCGLGRVVLGDMFIPNSTPTTHDCHAYSVLERFIYLLGVIQQFVVSKGLLL